MKGTTNSVHALGMCIVMQVAAAFSQAPRPAAAPPLQRADTQLDPTFGREAERRTPVVPSGTPSNFISSAAGDYVLGAADTIEVSIYREPDLTTRCRVGSDGTVQLPLIREVRVAGLTVRDARELIRKKYDEDYIVDPQISLNLIDFAKREFTILGQVVKPGPYEIPGGRPLGLLQAIGMAGGFGKSADKGKVIVRRTTPGGAEGVIKVNAKKLSAGAKETFEIKPGDVITVEESWF